MPGILSSREVHLAEPIVTPVGSDAFDRILDVPALVEGAGPGFVPPLREAVRRELAGAAVPGGEVQPFLCERGGRPVGRATAIVNPRLADEAGAPVGQVGHLSCADDPGAALALLEACRAWLRARGARRVLAPMNGGVHLGHRVMTAGFDRSPFLLEPRNPRWLPGLLEGAGFRPVHRWRTWELERPALEPLRRRLGALALRADRDPARRTEVVWLDTAGDGPGALARVHALLERAWVGNFGWTSITLEELAASFGVLLPLMPTHHAAVLVDRTGRDVGFGFMLPDWIDEVRALRGDVSGWGHWMGSARARRVIAHTVAVVPEVRGLAGAAKLIATGLGAALEHGYDELVFPLTTETFRYWDHALPPPTREYALFGREA
jgi:hypothetical protein